jgi:hypothetical protein
MEQQLKQLHGLGPRILLKRNGLFPTGNGKSAQHIDFQFRGLVSHISSFPARTSVLSPAAGRLSFILLAGIRFVKKYASYFHPYPAIFSGF